LIVDDESSLRELARLVIESADEDLTVVGEAANGLDAVSATAALHPSVVLLDLRMPGIDGLEAAARILAAEPEQVIVLFSASLTAEQRDQAHALGVRACVEKRDVADIPNIIRAVAAA
jgi:DNA-binding NarL/FixJ family response regulator